MNLSLRLTAEGIGSLLLAATVVGSGVMAERLAGGNLAIALLANTAATVAVLATLIALLGPVSGADFNPAVSLVKGLRGSLPWGAGDVRQAITPGALDRRIPARPGVPGRPQLIRPHAAAPGCTRVPRKRP
jgi:Major intrinsic protein